MCTGLFLIFLIREINVFLMQLSLVMLKIQLGDFYIQNLKSAPNTKYSLCSKSTGPFELFGPEITNPLNQITITIKGMSTSAAHMDSVMQESVMTQP